MKPPKERSVILPAVLVNRLAVMARERGQTLETLTAELLSVCLGCWETDERPYRLSAGLPLEG